MRQLVFIVALVLFHFQSHSQIKIETERDKDNNIRFYAVNDEIIPYSIIIEFKDLVNLTPSGGMKTIAVATPGRTAVAKLTKNVTNQSDNYRYSISSHRGNYRAKTKSDIAYLVPVAEGESVTLSSMTHIENRIKGENYNDDYVGVSFRFKDPTIICAPRKGIVSSVKVEEELTGNSYTYSALDNYIELYHEDGTFTKVSVVKSGSAKVKKGDIVYPGTPLAESAGEKYQTGPHVKKKKKKNLNGKLSL